jgi:hypothetical protein
MHPGYGGWDSSKHLDAQRFINGSNTLLGHYLAVPAVARLAVAQGKMVHKGERRPRIPATDGHHRLELCARHGLSFDVVECTTAHSRAEAKLWIFQNQLARRNLTPYERAEIALQMEPIIAELAKARRRTHTEEGYQKSDKAVHTLDELGKMAGVSRDTIYKARVIAEEADEDTKQQLRRGERYELEKRREGRPEKLRHSDEVSGET